MFFYYYGLTVFHRKTIFNSAPDVYLLEIGEKNSLRSRTASTPAGNPPEVDA